MSSHPGGSSGPLLTVLYIGGFAVGPNVEQLRHEGIGVVAVHSGARALQLLKNFRVAAVICDVPDLSSIASLAATQTPVILLAGQGADWGGPEVTVLSRRIPSPELARYVRQLAATNGSERGTQHAA
jgi:CheY-like chemotaxis protein